MTDTATGERADLLEALAAHRHFLRFTVRGLSDEQARLRPTASELTLGGLLKHVAHQEAHWVRFIVEGTEAMATPTDAAGNRAPQPVRRSRRRPGRTGGNAPGAGWRFARGSQAAAGLRRATPRAARSLHAHV